MARRNPQDTIATLREELGAKEERVDELEDENDRLRGRLSRVAALTEDILDDPDVDDDDDEDDDDEDEDEDVEDDE